MSIKPIILLITLLLSLATPSMAVLPDRYDAFWADTFGFPGVEGQVNALVADGRGNLYVGGEFTTWGGTVAKNIARFDGRQWSPLGSGIDAPVSALAVDKSGNLYAGGDFIAAGGVSASNIARWDGSRWSPLGSGTDGSVYSLALDGSGILYVGGVFYTAGGKSSFTIAAWRPPVADAFLPGIYR